MKHRALLVCSILLLCDSVNAQEEEWDKWPMGSRFVFELELFRPNLDTLLRVDSTEGVLGTPIDFEQDLGMSDTESLASLLFEWRFAKKHRLAFEYYELERSGTSITATIIEIGDKVFEVDLPISSFMDMDVATVSYSYSFLFDEKREFAISGGLTVMDTSIGILGEGSLGVIEANTDLTAPLPTIGLMGGYTFSDKLFFRGSAGYFSFDLSFGDEDGLRGDIAAANVALYHRTFDNVRFGLAYNYYDVDVDWGNALGFNTLQYTYNGPALNVAITF